MGWDILRNLGDSSLNTSRMCSAERPPSGKGMTAVAKDAELGKRSWISGILGGRIKLSQATAPEPSSIGRDKGD